MTFGDTVGAYNALMSDLRKNLGLLAAEGWHQPEPRPKYEKVRSYAGVYDLKEISNPSEWLRNKNQKTMGGARQTLYDETPPANSGQLTSIVLFIRSSEGYKYEVSGDSLHEIRTALRSIGPYLRSYYDQDPL